MTTSEPGGTPRLVYDADAPKSAEAPSAPETAPDRKRWRSALRVLVAALLVAVAIVAVEEWRRAAALEARVEELTASLASAQREIAARRAQIDTIRGSLADVRERIHALESVAAADPAAPPAQAPSQTPAH
ncbi:MAG: hypothetical protein DCC71_01920 [Proteobacteria bacterium]|nr:MAG: hypothetical protein DCC71_01920 [Pseudomonadota bacterium]